MSINNTILKINESSLALFKSNLPKPIYQKLALLKDRTFKSDKEFKDILQTLLADNYNKHIDEILQYAEQIEGDEDTQEEDTYDPQKGSIYPYDPTKADIDIREAPQTVFELVVRKWNKGNIIMPEFQRKFVWKSQQQSRFIESVLLNFPLPPFYVNKTTEGKYLVVDGLQRITTLRNFLDDKFPLQDLRALPQLNGLKFSELISINNEYQSKIEDKNLLIYLIQPSVPMEMVYDIFNRINTGGTQLERQEIRNCVFMGEATKFLKTLAESDIFKKAIDFGISNRRAKDQEAVLRYLAFRVFDYKKDYGTSMNAFVEKTMKFLNIEASNTYRNKLETDFYNAMELTYDFFGKQNFRIPTQNTRGRINIAVLETVAGFFANQSKKLLQKNKKQIVENFHNRLLKDDDYINAVRFSTGDKKRVKIRFEKVDELLSFNVANPDTIKK